MLKSPSAKRPRPRFRLVEWTFDPLELKNAYFNIEKLGAVIRNIFPITTASLPAASAAACPPIAALPVKPESPAPGIPTLARIPVPAGLDRLRAPIPTRCANPAVARLFQQNLAGGLAVTGFERSSTPARTCFIMAFE
jgi:hypothetical protein